MAGTGAQPLIDEEQGLPRHISSANSVGNALPGKVVSARDVKLVDGEKPADKVKMKGPNGEEEDVDVAPKMLGCANLTPPGCWYGPFGFLRMVAVAFLLLAVLSFVLIFFAFSPFNFLHIFTRMVLVAAAIVAAAAAYSHEGLAAQVTLLAKKNDVYSANNDKFEEQLEALSDVAQKLDQLAEKGNMNLDKLINLHTGLERISDLAKINTLVRAFTDAETRNLISNGEKAQGILDNVQELMTFLDGSASVLTHNIPNLDQKKFKHYSMRGICLTVLAALIAAANTEVEQESTTFVALMFFILDPRKPKTKTKLLEAAVIHMVGNKEFGTRELIEKELDRLIATVPEESNDDSSKKPRIKEDEVRKFASALISHREVEDEDLGLSDDEDDGNETK